MARQGLQKRGSYGRSGIGSGCGRFSSACTAIRGVHRMPSGITIRAASIRELGHAFHAQRSPSIASSSLKSIPSLFIQITLDLTTINQMPSSLLILLPLLPPTDFIDSPVLRSAPLLYKVLPNCFPHHLSIFFFICRI